MRSTTCNLLFLVATILAASFASPALAQEQHCSLCSEDQAPVQSDQPIPKGGTCGEVHELAKNLTADQCQEKEKDLLVAGVRCGCRDPVDFPTCGVQQNPDFCTTGLLARAKETCECYSFCGMDFVGCKRYPGDRLAATNCDTWAVSGCNYASATEGPNPFLLCVGLCPDGSSIQYPDRIIPSNSVIPTLNGSAFPTCQQANEYLLESDGLDCTILQSLALYCGCQTSTAPTPPGLPLGPGNGSASDVAPPSSAPTLPSCTFCPDDQVSQNLAFETPFGFTCADLVDYFKFLPLPLDCKKENLFGEDGDSSVLNKITDFWVDDLEWESLYEMCQCIALKEDDDGGGGGGTAALKSAAQMDHKALSSFKAFSLSLSFLFLMR